MLRWPERFDGALIMAGMKVRAERRDRLFLAWDCAPDPARFAGLAARLFTKALRLLLLLCQSHTGVPRHNGQRFGVSDPSGFL